MKPVVTKESLSTSKYYAINANSHGAPLELCRYVGSAEGGQTFVIVNHLVRGDQAMCSIAVKDAFLPRVVFELEGDE